MSKSTEDSDKNSEPIALWQGKTKRGKSFDRTTYNDRAEEEVLMKPPPDVAAMEEADAAYQLSCPLLQFHQPLLQFQKWDVSIQQFKQQ